MKVSALHQTEASKARQLVKDEAEQQKLNALADLELLKQELSGLAGATKYFQEFYVGRKLRYWLIPGEDLDVLSVRPERVSWALSNLQWIKSEIKRLYP